MNKIITIVTPSFNQGQFIEQTIKSVLSQEGGFFIDYIITDGGSTDNSLEIIKKYDELLKTKKYHIKCKGIGYRWWSRPDKGQSHAINQGFKIAKGDVLAWINSDDYYEASAFEFIMKKFSENPDLDLINGDCYGILYPSNKKIIGKSSQQTFEKALRKGNNVMQPAVFLKKEIFNKVGQLDENLHYNMDIDLWLRILQKGRTLYIPKILATFRQWEESKSISEKKNFWPERREIYKKYGGRFFDPVFIYRLRYKIPFSNYIKNKFPKLYSYLKNKFYYFYNKYYYNKKIK